MYDLAISIKLNEQTEIETNIRKANQFMDM